MSSRENIKQSIQKRWRSHSTGMMNDSHYRGLIEDWTAATSHFSILKDSHLFGQIRSSCMGKNLVVTACNESAGPRRGS